jgi:hypothetical protein
VEALEDARQLALGDAGAGVAHREHSLPALGADRDRDLAVESELEGVGDEIEDDLLPHVTVDIDRLGKWRAVDDESKACFLHGSAKAAGEIRRNSGEIGGLVYGLNTPCLEAGEVE